MGYADKLLATGERIVLRERQHWIVIVDAAKWAILALIAALALFLFSSGLEDSGFAGAVRGILGWVALGLVIGALIALPWTILQWMFTEFIVTNRRVMQVRGVINKTASDSSLEKVNDAQISQSIFGRALNFGNLDILTASETGIERIKMLNRPIDFKRTLQDAKHELELSYARPDIPSPALRAGVPAGGEIPPPPAAPVVPPPAATAPPPPPSADVAPSAADSAGKPAGAPATELTPEMAAHTAVAASGAMAAPEGSVPNPAPDRVPPADAEAGRSDPPAASSASAASGDVMRTLASLADLRDRGAITPEEYETKKAELLGRL